MSKITTEDCKKFIVSHYEKNDQISNFEDWKRDSKHKQNGNWVRNFSHPTLGSISLVEINDQLEINSNGIIEEQNNKKYFTTFTKEEIKGAKELIKKTIKMREAGELNDEDFDITESKVNDLFNSNVGNLYKHAIPSQFTFSFPLDTASNNESNKTNGLDTKIFPNGEYSSFMILFENKHYDEINDILVTQRILPKWLDLANEELIKSDDQSLRNMTVREFINILFDMGFKHEEGYLGCLFLEEINNYVLQLQGQTKSTKFKNSI